MHMEKDRENTPFVIEIINRMKAAILLQTIPKSSERIVAIR
jgi:hypothetical protein